MPTDAQLATGAARHDTGTLVLITTVLMACCSCPNCASTTDAVLDACARRN